MQVDLSQWQSLDIIFVLPPTQGEKLDYHYKSAFYLAVVSMITGWKMDVKVGVLGMRRKALV